jgi:hypothetical protein
MNTVYSTTDFYVSTADANPSADIVPWVADFTDPAITQRMVPRPFYCTRYTQDGSPGTHFVVHDWFFYTLLNSVTIPSAQLFVDTNWQWEASDG